MKAKNKFLAVVGAAAFCFVNYAFYNEVAKHDVSKIIENFEYEKQASYPPTILTQHKDLIFTSDVLLTILNIDHGWAAIDRPISYRNNEIPLI